MSNLTKENIHQPANIYLFKVDNKNTREGGKYVHN